MEQPTDISTTTTAVRQTLRATLRPRWFYLDLKLEAAVPCNEVQVYSLLRSAVRSMFGNVGLAASMDLLKWDTLDDEGILRVDAA